jgi:hypothetical protein
MMLLTTPKDVSLIYSKSAVTTRTVGVYLHFACVRRTDIGNFVGTHNQPPFSMPELVKHEI